MTLDHDGEMGRLTQLWAERFGEPPPIIAEPELMRRVLDQMESQAEE
jgi:hypothetical protein